MNNNIYVKVPFSLKDQAKSLNAKYNPENKSWYVTTEQEKELVVGIEWCSLAQS